MDARYVELNRNTVRHRTQMTEMIRHWGNHAATSGERDVSTMSHLRRETFYKNEQGLNALFLHGPQHARHEPERRLKHVRARPFAQQARARSEE